MDVLAENGSLFHLSGSTIVPQSFFPPFFFFFVKQWLRYWVPFPLALNNLRTGYKNLLNLLIGAYNRKCG